MKKSRTCETCGKTFLIHPCEARTGRGRFCSRACRMERWRRTSRREARTCKQCGRLFTIIPDPRNSAWGQFCSVRCKDIGSTVPVSVRFGRFVGKTTETGCVLWNGLITLSGYGYIAVRERGRARKILAHRVAWEAAHGAIHDGLYVCHHCDNKRCVNVEHLFLGTQGDNLADMVQKGRSRAQLSKEQVIAIRRDYALGGVTCAAVARQYHTTPTVVHRAVTRKTWKHIA